MLIYRHASALPATARGAVVAIGNFDGVHLGHQAVIGLAARLAAEQGVKSAVLSFEPHPRSVLQPDAPPFRLTPFRAKAELLAEFGVAILYSLRFDRALMARSADAFIRDILVAGLGIRHAVVGYDFVFGHRRGGNARMLAEAGRALGFGVTTVEPVAATGGVYSSTSVREHLQNGRPRDAAALLGRPWEIEGRVEHGNERGRTIGFPTANLRLDGYLRPAFGAYAVRARAEPGSSWRPGVANFGLRPTVGGTVEPLLEAHLFDFAGDLYGRHLSVAFIDYLRPERKFSGLDALREQIARDGEAARNILANK
jgi:riboflavin kinase/FMN adenylyltransferase